MLSRFPFLFLFFVVGCRKSQQSNSVVLPSNLTTTINANEGTVQVSASAENANFYTSTFFEDGDSTEVESSDGFSEYTFNSSGTYLVNSKAHTDYYKFYSKKRFNFSYCRSGFTGGIPTTGYSTPMTYPGYTLVWNDEFDGNALSSDWTHEIGNGNWGWETMNWNFTERKIQLSRMVYL